LPVDKVDLSGEPVCHALETKAEEAMIRKCHIPGALVPTCKVRLYERRAARTNPGVNVNVNAIPVVSRYDGPILHGVIQQG
jgi:hypothetical protein